MTVYNEVRKAQAVVEKNYGKGRRLPSLSQDPRLLTVTYLPTPHFPLT